MRLNKKVALIAGAAHSTSRAEALLFAKEGASVVVAARKEDLGNALTKAITDAGGTALFVKLDVSDQEQWAEAIRQVKERFGALHILVNNAGTNAPALLPKVDKDIWNTVFATNVMGTLLTIQPGFIATEMTKEMAVNWSPPRRCPRDILRRREMERTIAMARTPKIVEDRREQILDAAIRVFARKGFSRTINSDIAREAGITSALIYYYFQSKEEMLQAIMETRSPLHLMRSLPPQTLEMPPAEFLPFLISQVLEVVESEPIVNLLRIFLPELLHHSEVLEPLRTQVISQLVSFFQGYYTRQQELGQVSNQVDSTFQAHMTISCLVGFLLRRQIVNDVTVTHYSQQELAMRLSTTILKGIEAC